MNQLQRNENTIKVVLENTESMIYSLTGLHLTVYAKHPKGDLSKDFDEADIIIYNLCKIWQIPKSEILIKRKVGDKPNMIKIICMLVKFEFPKYPLVKIAAKLGIENHASIIHNITFGNNLLEVQDAQFMKYYEPVKHLFKYEN